MLQSDLLASVNCAAGVLSPDTLQRHLTFLKQALQERTRLLSNNGYGIVDSTDPRYNSSNDSTKPLWASFAVNDYTHVNVYPGMGVTPNGDIVKVDAMQTVTVPGVYRGDESLIIAQYVENASGQTALTLDNRIVDVGVVPSTIVFAVLRSAYEQYTQDELDSMIVLGTVYWSDSTAPILFTDYSNGYSWNRPWFSAADTIHRSLIGSGTQTVNNPHGTGLNDLAVGRLTIYDQLTSSGMVLSKDTSTPGIPGYLCVDSITTDAIKTDSNGEVTYTSWFSRPGRFYLQLSTVPNCIHRVVDTAGTEIAVEWIKGTANVLLIVDTKPTNTVYVYYSRSGAGSIAKSDSTSVTFTQISDAELVIVNGQAKTSLARLTTPVKRYGGVPRELGFQVGSSGQVYVDPAIVIPFTEVNLSANTPVLVDTKLPSQGHAGIAIVNMQKLNTTYVAFRINGVDPNGIAISEIVDFDSMTWDSPQLPADYENPMQVHYTTQVFGNVAQVVPLDTTERPMKDVGNALFALFLKQDPALSRTVKLATAFWDGQEMIHLTDARRVLPVVRDGWYGYTSLHQAAEAIPGIDDVLGTGNSSQLIFAEDFAQPMALAANTVEWDGAGILSVPVIDPNLANSDSILRCYRSRAIPLKVGDADWTRIVVLLFGGDSNVNKQGAVRIVYRTRAGARAEGVLVPFDRDGSGSLFVGFVDAAWNSVSFVISGQCRGFAAYFVRPTTVDQNYVIVPV